MRVNISYSVELEEVLERLWTLYHSEKEKLDNKMQEVHSTLVNQFSDEDLGQIAKAIQQYRAAMASFDVKLAEISNILSGYYAIKYNPVPALEQEKPPEIEGKNE